MRKEEKEKPVSAVESASRSPAPNSALDMGGGTRDYTERQQILPSKLDIEMQENVTHNLAHYNMQKVESRKKMAERRNSRPDTLNQLVSPREHFEMTH